GRPMDAVAELRAAAARRPALPAAWYALGQAYNAVKQETIDTFDGRDEDFDWRQLLAADALLGRRRWTDAFFLYRAVLERRPSIGSIHDSVARIYERTGHADWAARERAAAGFSPTECGRRKAWCEFRAGRYREALAAALSGTDAESRYWRARA